MRLTTETERVLESRLENLEQNILRADAIQLHPRTVTESVRTCFVLIGYQLKRIQSIKTLNDVPIALIEGEERALQTVMDYLLAELGRIKQTWTE